RFPSAEPTTTEALYPMPDTSRKPTSREQSEIPHATQANNSAPSKSENVNLGISENVGNSWSAEPEDRLRTGSEEHKSTTEEERYAQRQARFTGEMSLGQRSTLSLNDFLCCAVDEHLRYWREHDDADGWPGTQLFYLVRLLHMHDGLATLTA